MNCNFVFLKLKDPIYFLQNWHFSNLMYYFYNGCTCLLKFLQFIHVKQFRISYPATIRLLLPFTIYDNLTFFAKLKIESNAKDIHEEKKTICVAQYSNNIKPRAFTFFPLHCERAWPRGFNLLLFLFDFTSHLHRELEISPKYFDVAC